MHSFLSKLFGASPVADAWPDQTPLILWNGKHPWTIADSFEGVQVFGDTGSGKSSASARVFSSALLRAGYSGLVLTVKPDDREEWFDLVRLNQREDDLIVFHPASGDSFNILEYQVEHGRKLGLGIRPAVDLLEELVKLAGASSGASDTFWQKAARTMLTHALQLLVAAREPLSVWVLELFVQTAPKTPAQARDPLWQQSSHCWRIMKRARLLRSHEPDVQQALDYWLHTHCELNEKTRTSIEITFTAGVAAEFSGGLMHGLFGGSTTLTPDCFSKGKIVVVNLPVLPFGAAGRFAGVVWKYCTQLALERRLDKSRPVFIFSDEAHFFLTDYDALFQSTARSARCCTVYLSQNIDNYYAANPNSAGQHRVGSLLACLKTRVLHQCSHSETRKWLSDSVGKHLVSRPSETTNFGPGQPTHSESKTPADEYWIHEGKASLLKSGSTKDTLKVRAIVSQAGRLFSNEKPYLVADFTQRKIEASWWHGRTGVAIKLRSKAR